jgi:hypothetical protein
VVVLLVVGAVLAMALAFIVSRVAEARPNTISFEFYKLLIQALLLGAVGASLSAAIQEVRLRRDGDERRRTFRREHIESLLHDIDEDYRLIKRSRRMLQLELPIRHSLYRTEMVNLEDIQRSIEELEANISKLENEGVPELATVGQHLGAMNRYVDELWTEYESNARRSDDELPPSSLKSLNAFIADIDDGSFNRLKTSYRAARLELLGQLATIAGVTERENVAPDVAPRSS